MKIKKSTIMKRSYKRLCLLALMFSSQIAILCAQSNDVTMGCYVTPPSDLSRIPVTITIDNPTLEIVGLEAKLGIYSVTNGVIAEEPIDGSDNWFDTDYRAYTYYDRLPVNNIKGYNDVYDCPNLFYITYVDRDLVPLSGTTGPVVTVFFDGSSLADGDYVVRMREAMVVGASDFASHYCSDVDASFTIDASQMTPSISLNTNEVSLTVGDNTTLSATVWPSSLSQSVLWTSSNPGVATVSEDGVVTAVAEGTATITATSTDGTNLTASCTIKVERVVDAFSMGCHVKSISDLSQIPVTITIDKPKTIEIGAFEACLDVYPVTDGVVAANPIEGSYNWFNTEEYADNDRLDVVDGNVILYPNTAEHPNLFFISYCCSKISGNTGPVITVFFDGRNLADGDYVVRMHDAMAAGAGTYYCPDVDASFSVRNGNVIGEGNNTQSDNITFADANVKTLCVANWDTNGDGELSMSEAAAVTDLGDVFKYQYIITSFDELKYFTGLTSIKENTFTNCGLASVIIPNSVTSIGDGAFYYSGLTSIIIPVSVSSVNSAAFALCSYLTSIIVEEGNPIYDSRENCNSIIETQSNTLIVGCKGSTIPNSVTSIGDGAFNGCTEMTSIEIPNSVTSIGEYAFYFCSGLTSVTIPNSVTSIGCYAFCHDESLTSIEISNSVTSIPEGTFWQCTELKSLVIPNSVTNIGESAFYHCAGLTSIDIPNSVTSIEKNAFGECTGLTSIIVEEDNPIYDSRDNCNSIIETKNNILIIGCNGSTIPNSVTSIGESAFWFYSDLTSITIPNSVTSIGEYSFYNCSGLTSLTSEIENPFVFGNFAFSNISDNCVLYIPQGTRDAYITAGWTEDVFKGGIVEMEGEPASELNYAYDETSLTASVIALEGGRYNGNIVIPRIVKHNGETYQVTSIGLGAFQGCGALQSIIIPNSITSIETNAFRECNNLNEVILPNSLIRIGDEAFYLSGLTSVTIPASVKDIGSNVFGNSNVNSIIVDVGNTIYDSRDNCNAIIRTADNELIVGCRNTVIPNSVTSIGYCAFFACNGIGEMEIPNSVKNIGGSAFSYCGTLSSINIPEGVPSLGTFTFQYCSSLTTITIPSSITSMGGAVFSHCTGLTEVISKIVSPSQINNDVFDGVYNQATLYVPAGTKALYETTGGWNQFQNIVEMGGGTPSGSIPTEGLVAYYPFNGNANDESGNGNNGTPMDNVVLATGVGGDANGAYQFGGYDNPGHIYIPNSESLQFSDGVTFSAYIKPTSWLSMNGWGRRVENHGVQCFIAKSHDSSGLAFVLGDKDNGISFWSASYSSWDDISSDEKLNGDYLNKWTHVAFIYGQGFAQLYVDGNMISQEVTSPDFTSMNVEDLYIGKFSDYWYPFNGLIDEVRIYNRALEANEVRTLATMADKIDIEATDALYAEDLNTSSGKQEVLPIILNNVDAVSDLQFDLYLPEGVTLVNDGGAYTAVTPEERAQNHDCYYRQYEDGSVRIMCTSSEGYTFSGNSGTVLYVTLSVGDLAAGDYKVRLKDCVASNADSVFYLPDTEATITILAKHKLTFVVDGTVYGEEELVVGDAITALAEPTKEGYTFFGWSEVPDAMGDADIVVTGYFVDNRILELQALADSAQVVCNNAEEGTEPGTYCAGAKAELQAVIDEVVATITRAMTEDAIFDGRDKINAALAAFADKLISYTLGDINGDGNINVGDLSRLVRMILTNYSTVDNVFRAADINGDGQLNVGDYSRLVQMILKASAGSKSFKGTAKSNAYVATLLSAEPLNISAGGEKMLAINLNNHSRSFNALQFDIELPEGLTVDMEAAKTTSRNEDFELYSNGQRVIVCSNTGKEITGQDGTILYLPVKADDILSGGTYTINFTNAVLATIDSEVVYSNSFSSNIDVADMTAVGGAKMDTEIAIIIAKGKVSISAKDRKAVTIVNAAGGVIAKAMLGAGETRDFYLVPGVYIINNNKIIIR